MLSLSLDIGTDHERGYDIVERAIDTTLDSLPADHPVSIRARARKLINENRQTVALRMLESAIETTPPNERLERLYRAMLTANRLNDQALAWVDARLAMSPGEARYSQWRAGALLGRGDASEALGFLTGWLETYPGDDELRLALAEIHRRAFDDGDRADEIVSKLLAKRPPTLERQLLRLQIERRRDDLVAMTDAVRSIGDRYHLLTPSQLAAMYQYVEWARRIADRRPERTPEARAFISQIATLDPNLPKEVLGLLAFLDVASGESPREMFDRLSEKQFERDVLDRIVAQYALSVMSANRVQSSHYLFLEAAGTDGTRSLDRAISWLSAILTTAGRVVGDEVSPSLSVRRAVESLGDSTRIAAAVDGVVARLDESGIPNIRPADIAYSMAISCDRAAPCWPTATGYSSDSARAAWVRSGAPTTSSCGSTSR